MGVVEQVCATVQAGQRGLTLVAGGPSAGVELGQTLAQCGVEQTNIVHAIPSSGRWKVADVSTGITEVLRRHSETCSHLVVQNFDSASRTILDHLLLTFERPAGLWHIWAVHREGWTAPATIRGRADQTLLWAQTDSEMLAGLKNLLSDETAVRRGTFMLGPGADPSQLRAVAFLVNPDIDRDDLAGLIVDAATIVAGGVRGGYKNLDTGAKMVANSHICTTADLVATRWANRAGERNFRTCEAKSQAWSKVRTDIGINIPAASALRGAMLAS